MFTYVGMPYYNGAYQLWCWSKYNQWPEKEKSYHKNL